MAKLLSEASAKWINEQRGKVSKLASRLIRTPFVGGGFSGWRQWQVYVTDGGLRMRSGSLAWGGGHYAVWPSGRTVTRANSASISGTVPEGATRYVLWYTRCHACPLTNCPKAPNGTALCPAAAGDPESWKADAGDVMLAEKAERLTGWTDFRVIATVTRDADGNYAINQIQTAEITVRAIVYPGETGEESDDEDSEDATDCTDADSEKFPSDVDDAESPQDPEDGTGGGGDEDEAKFPSKTDVCW